jgi:hypothetical protein
MLISELISLINHAENNENVTQFFVWKAFYFKVVKNVIQSFFCNNSIDDEFIEQGWTLIIDSRV